MTADVTTLTVDLGERAYDIVIGENVLAEAGSYLLDVIARPNVVIISDENVAPLHLSALELSLDKAGIQHDSIILPAGESSKSFAVFQDLLNQLLALKVERQDTIIALGGGVIGDLAGFAAAVLRRGMNFVQIPTTLLAQVDSSVGGKTAINTDAGKNLVGAFHQPILVLADVGILSSLPQRELLAGYAEIVKYGLLGDIEFFSWLEKNGIALLDGDVFARTEAVRRSCRAKAEIVAQDEREGGIRALLNLGHTFGHALEAEAGYGGSLLHGEAVAIGMVQAFNLSAKLEYCSPADAARASAHLTAVGLATTPRQAGMNHAEADKLLHHMYQDKKVQDGKLTFILARGIGDAFITRDIEAADVLALLTEECAA